MDERADEGHEHDEGDGERVDAHAHVHGQPSRADPVVDAGVEHARPAGKPEQLDEDRGAHREGDRRRGDGEQVAPPVGSPAGDQEDPGAHEGDGHAQPHEAGRSRRLGRPLRSGRSGLKPAGGSGAGDCDRSGGSGSKCSGRGAHVGEESKSHVTPPVSA